MQYEDTKYETKNSGFPEM